MMEDIESFVGALVRDLRLWGYFADFLGDRGDFREKLFRRRAKRWEKDQARFAWQMGVRGRLRADNSFRLYISERFAAELGRFHNGSAD